MKIKYFTVALLLLAWNFQAQTPSSFNRIGSHDEKIQDLFPGSHRARPVMADFTNNGYMDLFYGGQDLGSAAVNFYLKEINRDTRWGDQEDGTYVNPILNSDYSDPDVIRVGNKYYMVCSDFHFMGMQVLESDDMVNWKLCGQIYNSIDFPKYYINERYGGGSWAPSIRFHDGKFWVFFCTPDEGLFMSNTTDPAGTWSPLLNVKNISGWEDPCPLWDDDGTAYLGRSQLGGGPIIIHKMKPDGTQLLDNGVKVYEGSVSEGVKLFKKDGFYYISIPEGGVSTGWQTVLRSSNIYGPYEKRIVLEQGSTKINGPHQGALVDTPDGEWWFYHFQSKDPQGRIVHLQPATWIDGFPVIGQDFDMNGIGEPVKEWSKPAISATFPVSCPQSDDEFSSDKLGLQWQFNHNPDNDYWSLTERPDYLVIKAQKADRLKSAKNMFSQKVTGYYGEASSELDCSKMTNGQRAGLFCTGNHYNAVGCLKNADKKYIYVEMEGVVENIIETVSDTVYFKVFINGNMNEHQFYYSFDNSEFIACGRPYSLQSGDWKGSRVGIFTYNKEETSGQADFNWFHYKFDGPGKYICNVTETDKPADWHVWNEMSALVKNNGDGSFTVVQEYDADIQVSIWTNAVFFDFNNDGNLDLLIVGKGGDWRFPMSQKYARLYRNLGADGNYLFQEVYNTGLKQYCDEEYLNTISVGDYDHDGFNDLLIMSREENENRSINLYRNLNGSGKFELQANVLPANYKPTANGSVMFGDLNNDGWLDIFHTGYSNIARGIGIYKNMQDGTFQDMTPANMPGAWQSQSVLADVNGDGTLDVFITGHGDNWARYSQLYYNTINPNTGNREFELHDTGATGIDPINLANILVADFNNDGYMDMIMNGYDGSKYLTRVYYQNEQGRFIKDGQRPIFPVKDGGINMGDVNGDGNMDVIIAGSKGSDMDYAYNSPVRIYENNPAEAGLQNNQPPSPPDFVNAEYKDGKLTISWGEATDDISLQSALRYNIFVKNIDTEAVWMLIPADVNTGRIKVGTDLQTALSSHIKEYVMDIPEKGNYSIGVQAIDQSYAGGRFTTVDKYFTSSPKIAGETDFHVQTFNNGFIIKSLYEKNITVFNIFGQKIASGFTNKFIHLSGEGVHIVKVAEKAIKLGAVK
ncbi:MAG: family 43 glycosylhydrolase [Dysgonamonadaceae bacterium]|jgi:beta-xylosidase|nr:family 43 glycosylhydrolase [Dysgonamonadaceae bacterium]